MSNIKNPKTDELVNDEKRIYGWAEEHAEKGHMFSDGSLKPAKEFNEPSQTTLKNWSDEGLIAQYWNLTNGTRYHDPNEVAEVNALSRAERAKQQVKDTEFVYPESGLTKLSDAVKFAGIAYQTGKKLVDSGEVMRHYNFEDMSGVYVEASEWREFISTYEPRRGRVANGVTLRLRIEDVTLFQAIIGMFENPSEVVTVLNKNMPEEFATLCNDYGLIKSETEETNEETEEVYA